MAPQASQSQVVFKDSRLYYWLPTIVGRQLHGGLIKMGFIPKRARWYLAEVVLEHVIEGDRRNLVHVNKHLVEAASPKVAHQKAIKLGRESQHRYLNTDGMWVRVKFRGLRELDVIHDELEDGAEIAYEEHTAVSESKLKQWATPKLELGVFAPRRPSRRGPNYMPLSIMRELEAAGFTRADMKVKAESAVLKRAPSSGRRKSAVSVAARPSNTKDGAR